MRSEKNVQLLANEEKQLKREMTTLAEMLTNAVEDMGQGADASELGSLMSMLDNVRMRLVGLRMAQRVSRNSEVQ